MLACRLCLAIGHDDPEAWLETATERQLALWKAFYRLEPWGAEFHRSATTQSLLSGLLSMTAAANGGKLECREFAEYMPSDWIDLSKSSKSKGLSVDTFHAIVRSSVPTAEKRLIR